MKQKDKQTRRIPKGQYGYMPSETKYAVLRTAAYFCISAAIFLTGWISTGTRMNLLTVVAVLGMLPASKSTVNMIMFLMNKGCSKESYDQIVPCVGTLAVLYDMVFTTYDKTFTIASLAIKGHNICGYSESAKTEENAAQKHLEDTLAQDGKKGYTVKIFHDMEKYQNRLGQLNRLEDETGNQDEIIEILLSVAL